MSRGTYAIVAILSHSTEPDSDLVTKYVADIAATCGCRTTDVIICSPKDIANMAISYVAKSSHSVITDKPTIVTPEDEAIVTVALEMEDYLGAMYKVEDFTAALVKKMLVAKKSDTEENNKFLNSLFILSQENLNVSKTILKKYKMDAKKISLIKKIYNLIC